MKKITQSYVENAHVDNQFKLICQYGGVSAKGLAEIVLKNNFVAYELPKAHTLECTWDFLLYLSSGEVLAFSSKCTGVGGWNEVGSLCIDVRLGFIESNTDVFSKTHIENFCIDNYSMLVYEEGEVYSESGICFTDDAGKKLIVVAAPAPGAVTVSIPNIDAKFKSEFSLSDYKYRAAVNA